MDNIDNKHALWQIHLAERLLKKNPNIPDLYETC